MKLKPPYQNYRIFRCVCGGMSLPGEQDRICIDLSILVYDSEQNIRDKLSAFWAGKTLQFISVNSTQLIVLDFKEETYVAFRGTETLNPHDWLVDADARQSDGVHEGFAKAYADVHNKVKPLVQGRKKVFFTGHSLGAALANVAARELYGLCQPCELVTFGSPRVFAAPVALAGDQLVPVHRRYVHGEDGVPCLPPEHLHDYLHAGKLIALEQMPRPWSCLMVPHRIFDHVPTLYAERIWDKMWSEV
jgi:hypothetical protein